MSALETGARHPLRELIDRYNEAWNRHDVDAIMAMHAPDMVFENHTAGERAEGARRGRPPLTRGRRAVENRR